MRWSPVGLLTVSLIRGASSVVVFEKSLTVISHRQQADIFEAFVVIIVVDEIIWHFKGFLKDIFIFFALIFLDILLEKSYLEIINPNRIQWHKIFLNSTHVNKESVVLFRQEISWKISVAPKLDKRGFFFCIPIYWSFIILCFSHVILVVPVEDFKVDSSSTNRYEKKSSKIAKIMKTDL